MAIAKVQGWTTASAGGSATTSLNVTLGSPSTTGDFMVVCFRNNFTSAGLAVTDITVTDDVGNTYLNAIYENGGGTFPAHQVSCGVWYCKSITGSASPVITCTIANSGFFDIDVAEFSGGVTPDPLDLRLSGIGTSTTPSSGTISPNYSLGAGNGLIVAIQSNNQTNTVTDGSGWTRIANNNGTSTSDYQISPSGSYTGTWTLAVNAGWEVVIADFSPAATVVDTQEWRGSYPPDQRRGGGPSLMYRKRAGGQLWQPVGVQFPRLARAGPFWGRRCSS